MRIISDESDGTIDWDICRRSWSCQTGSSSVVKLAKVKVKLSLCLSKYHAMKTYPLLHQSRASINMWDYILFEDLIKGYLVMETEGSSLISQKPLLDRILNHLIPVHI